jgi:Tol biopolymer transport system component
MGRNGAPRRATLIGAAALTGVMVMLVAAVTPASTRPSADAIAFESDRGGKSDLWVMSADGSNQVNLTNDKIEDVFPAWSPDRQKIAWTRGGRGPGGEIWVMNSDGSDKRQITFNNFPDFNVTWSPDGTRIAFRSLRAELPDIYVINVDGTGEQQLTNDPASDFAPDWSPDGTTIAFTSRRSGHVAVYSMSSSDGSDVLQLTPDAMEAALPGWSGDGSKVLFADGFCDTCSESDLFVMNGNGTGITQITDSPENELAKSWSRDDKRVVADFGFLTPSETHLSKGDIAVIEVATGVTENLTNTSGINEEHPAWSP